MRTRILILLLGFAIALRTVAAQSPEGNSAPDPFEQVRQMGRGVNIIGYDPIWRNTNQARFKLEHFKRIHDAGFQTVRVNLMAFSHMDASNQLSHAWLSTLDWVVSNGVASGLDVIVDEHDYSPMGSNPSANTPKLLAFWKQISERYRNQDSHVLFEILNEPNGQLNSNWNSVLSEALTVIRKTNPTRNVIIGPAFWNNVNWLDRLQLPADDRHIIATVHYYLPMEFTHQGARWNQATANLHGIKWGTDAEKKAVQDDFAKVQAWSEAQKRPMLLGEFGAYDDGGADMDSRVLYTSFVARTAESHHWTWTYWQFDSDFIVFDISKNDWVQPILKALVP